MSRSFPAIIFNTEKYTVEEHEAGSYTEEQTSITVLHQPWGPSRFRFFTVRIYPDTIESISEARQALAESLKTHYQSETYSQPKTRHPIYAAIVSGPRIMFYTFLYETGDLEEAVVPELGLWVNAHLYWGAVNTCSFLEIIKWRIEGYFCFE